ncbi:MAG: fibronectin type III domain-containing protein [Patescibacteria group bacterium]|nr:fibronectin type III domain-containing protein [Patescibacteria group bacterium]
MPLSIALTVGVDASSGPFPPTYPANASGFVAAASNPSGSSTGAITPATYFGAPIVAIANDAAGAGATQLLVALAGTYDQSFIGSVTTPDGKVYAPTAASYLSTLVNGGAVTVWIWALASGGSALASGTVTIGDTGDTLVNLEGLAQSSTEIQLSWTNVGPTPPASYQLWRGVASAVPTLYQTLAGTVTSYNDTALTASQQYNYYVVATYSDGTNAYSAELNLWTPASGVSNTFNCNCTSPAPDGWQVDTLANLRKRVAIRCGYAAQAANLPPGMASLINEFLRTAQNQLYRQHNEFRNKRMFAWQMEPNIRYYGLTQDESGCGALDPLSVEWVGFEDLNQAWYYLTAGIDPVMYTRAQISTGWPTNYEIRQCIEIFPAPRAPYTLWIKGRFGLTSFVNDTDVTTIDSECIYLLASGFLKQHYGQVDAASLMTQAENYTKQLVAGSHLTKRYVPRTHVERSMTPPRFLPLGNGPA